jgi:choline kinase
MIGSGTVLVLPIAVILAAGTGTRLQPLTDTTPKCLLDVGGRPLLGRLLDRLADAGIRRAVIVTGHLADRIEAHLAAWPPPLEVTTVLNHAYATTNNAASLGTARTAIGGLDFVLCDADVLFSANPIPALLASADECTLLVDADSPLDAEAMKVELGPAGRVTRIHKQLDLETSAGESIGIQKIGGSPLGLLWEEIDAIVALDAATAYYEDAFQRMIDRGAVFGICRVAPGSWIEIDDAVDLERARRRFSAL